MADIGGSIGGLLQGFNQTYWPAMRQNEAMALQKAQEERAKAIQDFQMQKYVEAEAKAAAELERKRNSSGFLAEHYFGEKPTITAKRDNEAIYNEAIARPDGDFAKVPFEETKSNPGYAAWREMDPKDIMGLIESRRKIADDARKEKADWLRFLAAERNADARAARGQDGGISRQPVQYINDENVPVWGTMADARGKRIVGFDPVAVGNKAAAAAGGTAQGKRDFNMQGVGDVVDAADKLLDSNPTNSGLGSQVDATYAYFGKAAPGSVPAQELKQLSAVLTAKMPRMEGPQSDKDVQMYKEAAGLIGDDTIPVARRKAALASVRNIVAKYDRGYNMGVPDAGARNSGGLSAAEEAERQALKKQLGR